MDTEWQMCKMWFSQVWFVSLRSYGPLILQDGPKMLLHKTTPSVSTWYISYLPQTLIRIIRCARRNLCHIRFVSAELWPLDFTKKGKDVCTFNVFFGFKLIDLIYLPHIWTRSGRCARHNFGPYVWQVYQVNQFKTEENVKHTNCFCLFCKVQGP